MSGSSATTTDPARPATAGAAPENASAAEIEREVERTRAGVENTLEELRERASPNRLFDEAVDWLRSSGGADFSRNLGRTLRDNPLPVVLIGAGIGWLALAGRSAADDGGPRHDLAGAGHGWRGAGRDLSPGAQDYPTTRDAGGTVYGGSTRGGLHAGREGTESTFGAARQGAESTLGAARHGAESAMDAAREGAATAYGSVQEGARSAYRAVAGAVGAAADAVGDTAESVSGGIASAGRRLGGSARTGTTSMEDGMEGGFRRIAEEQPLLIGALGLAIGAAFGALLPATRTEDRLLGGTRDRLADRATRLAGDTYEEAKATAREQLGGDEAPSGIREAVGDAAHRAREAVRGAAESVAERAKETMRPSNDDARVEARGGAEAPKPGPEGGEASRPGGAPPGGEASRPGASGTSQVITPSTPPPGTTAHPGRPVPGPSGPAAGRTGPSSTTPDRSP